MIRFSVSDLNAGYGAIPVLFDVNLTVKEGQAVALLGRNGVGKSTFMKTAMGYGTDLTSGSVCVDGLDLSAATSYHLSLAGMHFIPEHRGIFANLTVEEHLDLADRACRVGNRHAAMSRDELYSEFRILADRRAAFARVLSGGERQILAVCRAILCAPKVLLIDELSEGVQKVTIQAILRLLRRYTSAGGALLFVEQNSELAVDFSDVIYVMEKGKIVDCAPSEVYRGDPDRLNRRLAV